MIKVFLVEGETVVRDDIKNNIPWEEEGLEFTGETSDGELTYSFIRKMRPDALITGTYMPSMDGLKPSELAEKELPRIKITMLSGYNEFDYAKQTTHIGVMDYLLKLIMAAKLLEAVERVADVIEKKREDIRLMDKCHLEMAGNTVLECRRLLHDLVTRRVNFKEVLKHEEQARMDLSVFSYQLMLFRLVPVESAVVYPDWVVSCQETIEEWVESRQHVLVFGRRDEGWAFTLTGESEREVERRIGKRVASLGELAGACKGIQYFGGIGSCVNRLGDLQTSCLQVERAFAVRFFAEMSRVINCSQMSGMVHGSGETIDIHSVDMSKVNRKTLENFLKQGTVGEVSGFVEEYFQSVGEKNCQSSTFRQYIVMDCYLYISTFLGQLGLNMGRLSWELSDMEKVLRDNCTLGMLRGRLAKLSGEVTALRDSQVTSKYSQVLGKAGAFIHGNYTKEEISLSTATARVNTSPSYFSSILSRKMGVTFVEYLIGARMEKAKELLMCSNLKTSEIGYEVRYRGSHYFGYLFKKTIGCTPKEYRAGSRKVL